MRIRIKAMVFSFYILFLTVKYFMNNFIFLLFVLNIKNERVKNIIDLFNFFLVF